MHTHVAVIVLAVIVGLAGCGEQGASDAQESPADQQAGAEQKAERAGQGMDAALQKKLEQAGVKLRQLDEGGILVVEGFPYQKELTGGDTIEIARVENGIFTASERSTVPTAMMGMVYGVAGGSFVARCTAEDGTQTLADAVGNTWVFVEPGMSFFVFFPGSKEPAYMLRSKVPQATISFRPDGVLVNGFEFIVAPDG